MVQNFATAPSNIMPGIQALTGAVQSYGDFQRDKAKRGKLEQLKQQASEMLNKSPDELIEFVKKNPEAIDIYDKMIGMNKNIMVESAKRRIIGGEEPVSVAMEAAEAIGPESEDAQEHIDNVKEHMSSPETAREKDLKILALYDPTAYKSYMAQQGKGAEAAGKLGSQEILEDGTIIQSTSKGPIVYNPQGEKVTGQDAADTIVKARAEKVSNERLKSGGKKRASLEAELDLKNKVEAKIIGAKEAAKISVKAFDRLEGINQNIRHLEEGIGLLREEGANTGVIDKYLPSLKKATIRMDNLQGRLGLDVLRNTTFGALSASELRFALDTAVPKGLQPADLADWFEEKKEVQERLADYIEASAIYLGTPGNTVVGWMQEQKAKKAQKGKGDVGRNLQDFIQKAKAANPGATDQEITEFYNKKYGGQ